jgi:L-seryl-tRNA(Ser) seleniumtransferase
MNDPSGALRRLPAVNALLALPEVTALLAAYGRELTLFSLRTSLEHFRNAILQGASPPDEKQLLAHIKRNLRSAGTRSLRKVINATGVVIHTNLGRAPFGKEMLEESMEVLEGYNNLEFDLEKGSRGHRNDHAASLLKYLTGAEDVLVVNNNAAAVMLILRAFAKRKEVIVSRGELVEIGGSFRIPEIMAASDCKMVEVGTTNKTRLDDYRQAIGPKTAMLFKAHRSNYVISGFTEEVGLDDLAALGKESGIPVLFDLGSGLMRPLDNAVFDGEPDVRSALQSGVDLLCFSGDKLLGGPQAGIIAGRKDLIARLKKEPMLRALRVCKLTLALLEGACLSYLGDDKLLSKNSIHRTISRTKEDILDSAKQLKQLLEHSNISCEIIESQGQCGGGTLPAAVINSMSVQLIHGESNKIRSGYAEKMMQGLLRCDIPVLGILKQGSISFDMLCILQQEIKTVADAIVKVDNDISSKKR